MTQNHWVRILSDFFYLFHASILILREDTFLQINDQINSVITRYEAFKKGDFTVASNPIPTELSNSRGLSLIDLDDEPLPTTTAAGGNDLAGLFSTPSAPVGQAPPLISPFSTNTPTVHVNVMGTSMSVPTPMGMGTPMGVGTPMFMQPQPQTYAPTPLTHNGARNTGMGMVGSMTPPHQSATPPASIMLPNTPGPNYFGAGGHHARGPVVAVAGMGSSMGGSAAPRLGVGMGAAPYAPSPPITQPQQQQQHQPAPSSTTAQQGKDPFADLAGLF
jgi:ADP-ribosylation factor-binding protein GGA